MRISQQIVVYIKRLVFISVLMVGLQLSSNGQQEPVRQFNHYKVDSLAQLKKYQYNLPVKPPVSFWEQFKWYLNKLWNAIFGDSTMAVSFRYVVIVLVVVLLVFQLFRAEVSGLFYKKNRQVNTIQPAHNQNIFKFNFDTEIKNALEQDNYREVIRFSFLKILKQLHDSGHIQWTKTKTNSDFIYELKQVELKDNFKKLSSWFEYIVYGDFILDVHVFNELHNTFDEFSESLKNNHG